MLFIVYDGLEKSCKAAICRFGCGLLVSFLINRLNPMKSHLNDTFTSNLTTIYRWFRRNGTIYRGHFLLDFVEPVGISSSISSEGEKNDGSRVFPLCRRISILK